jgi:hypothetical protein
MHEEKMAEKHGENTAMTEKTDKKVEGQRLGCRARKMERGAG